MAGRLSAQHAGPYEPVWTPKFRGVTAQLMASVEECERAMVGLAARLDGVDEDVRKKHSVDRSISCTVPDLGVIFSGRIVDGAVQDLARSPLPTAQIRLTVNSDDLVALTAGELNIASAWASGRLRIEASVMDLLRLRSIL